VERPSRAVDSCGARAVARLRGNSFLAALEGFPDLRAMERKSG
jgi:hypothetical protein